MLQINGAASKIKKLRQCINGNTVSNIVFGIPVDTGLEVLLALISECRT